MSLSATILAVLLVQMPAASQSASHPVFLDPPCGHGYEWNAKKKKCVKKERDY